MRGLVWSLLFTFLMVPAASATETEPAGEALAEVVPTVVADAPADADLHLQEIQLEERRAADDASAAQLPPRGSFWWLVGVVVVAGVIVAVLL